MGIVKQHTVKGENSQDFVSDFLTLIVGIFVGIYPCLVHLNSVTTILFGIMLYILYLVHDLTVSAGVVEKMKRAIKSLYKKELPEKWSSDLSVLLDAENRESKRLEKRYRELLDAEKRESKRLEERCNSYNSLLESYRRATNLEREQELVDRWRKEKEVKELKDKVKELEEGVRTYEQDIIVELDHERLKNEELKDKVKKLEEEVRIYEENIRALNVDIDHERSKLVAMKEWVLEKMDMSMKDVVREQIGELKEGVFEKMDMAIKDLEREKIGELKKEIVESRVVMKDKDLLVKHLQGELHKRKNSEDVKEQELSVLKCEIAQLRCARGEKEREVLKLEKKLKEVEAEKEELMKTVNELEEQCEELVYSNQVLTEDMEKIESFRDSFNQQVVTERERIVKLLEDQLLEKAANTRNNDNDDEGYEVV